MLHCDHLGSQLIPALSTRRLTWYMPMHKTIEHCPCDLKMILALDPAFRRGTTIIYEIENLPWESQQTGKPQVVSREDLLVLLRPDVDALVQKTTVWSS
jgi:hypothetical protein